VSSLPGRNVLILDQDRVITSHGAVTEMPRTRGAAEMMDRFAGIFNGDGTVFFTHRDTHWQGLADAPGWTFTGSNTWHTATRHDSRIRFGHLAHIDPADDPLLVLSDLKSGAVTTGCLVITAVLHQVFHDMVGVPFYAEGGTTSALLLEQTLHVRGEYPLRRWNEPHAPRVAESPWAGPLGDPPDGSDVVTLDRNAQYLAAAGQVVLPLDALERYDGRPGALPLRGHVGYWCIRVPDNPEPRLPHPCGAGAVPGELLWVTSPTAEFLTQLGIKLDITAAWTCPRIRARRLLSGRGTSGGGKWYERLRDARARLLESEDEDAAHVLAAVKEVYRRGVGALNRNSGRWYRPDWQQFIHAQARTSMWRAMHQIGQKDSLWPAATHTDNVTYDRLPPSARVGDGMGEWRIVS
jgi:hypothetical protein